MKNELMSIREWKNECIWMNEWMNEWMNDGEREGGRKVTNERMNVKVLNEWMFKHIYCSSIAKQVLKSYINHARVHPGTNQY